MHGSLINHATEMRPFMEYEPVMIISFQEINENWKENDSIWMKKLNFQ